MNRNQIIAILLVIACCFSSCEKDDLCIPEELDIPRLVIVFVDARNSLLRKPVESLQVINEEAGVAVALDGTGALTLTQVDSIAIPLRIDQNFTDFEFTRTLNGAVNGDPIRFEYVQEEIYLNRACGYGATFLDLTAIRPDEDPANPWITNVTVRDRDVTSKNDIHVEIRH
ncbi:hypothetical protein SAMN05192588_0156 [Nonlabens sp. Hel1_33_55]|uniref:DUF6452 family protein n=1 Tax=Nonlabens sp. Hel1_33_55 TaxID=1336802 RepID=UPI000875C3D0|nr:DUF6452 family protein [Nonlabens sp. Hel1_33_55]SCX89688.1 hypothetical protein SAMN05192588_0156 [Nonlabens sp. Hel1_33_55]